MGSEMCIRDREWVDENDVHVISCCMTPNQEPFVGLESTALLAALAVIQQPDLRPLLIHCIRGQQTTGVLVGCLRRRQRWSLTATFEEYRRYAGPTASMLDLQMIELLDTSTQAQPLGTQMPARLHGMSSVSSSQVHSTVDAAAGKLPPGYEDSSGGVVEIERVARDPGGSPGTML